jgi:hypothetical protein
MLLACALFLFIDSTEGNGWELNDIRRLNKGYGSSIFLNGGEHLKSLGRASMDEGEEQINRISNQIVHEYRAYFALLHNYQRENHEKIMMRLKQVKELESELKGIAGKEAGSKLFMACYHAVLNEQEIQRIPLGNGVFPKHTLPLATPKTREKEL